MERNRNRLAHIRCKSDYLSFLIRIKSVPLEAPFYSPEWERLKIVLQAIRQSKGILLLTNFNINNFLTNSLTNY